MFKKFVKKHETRIKSLPILLAMISRQRILINNLCGAHNEFIKFTRYQLKLSRIVVVNHSKHLVEWMTKVLADPDDRTFSLLPGVSVSHMIISPPKNSGADCICVALPPNIDEASQHDSLLVHQVSATKQPGLNLQHRYKCYEA